MKKFLAVLLAVALSMSLSFSAVAAENSEPVDELTTREKIIQMAGREPDCYVVLLEEGSVEVSESEFFNVAEKLKNGTLDSTQYENRIDQTRQVEEPLLDEEYYLFNSRAITNSITPHTISGNTIMWYGSGYQMNAEGLLTFEISFSAKPSNAYAVLKKDGVQTASNKISSADYVTAYIALSKGVYYPGVKNSASSSISVTGGEINCAA